MLLNRRLTSTDVTHTNVTHTNVTHTNVTHTNEPVASVSATDHAEEGRRDGEDSGFVEGIFGIHHASLEYVETHSEHQEKGPCVYVIVAHY